MEWVNDYIGIPFLEHGRERDGVDCWGLARLVYSEKLGIVLPSYVEGYQTTEDKIELAALIDNEKQAWEEVKKPQQFDILVFSFRGQPMHIGIYIGDEYFMHCMKGIDSCLEVLSRSNWETRLVGVYRYVK